MKDIPTYEELEARCRRLEKLYEVSQVIHGTLDPQEALDRILRQAVQLVHGSSGSVVLINPTTGFLEILASHRLPAQTASHLKLRIGQGITGWVAREGRPARVGDVDADPRFIRVRRSTRSELAVPLDLEMDVHGVLNVDSDRRDAFSEEDQELLGEIASQAALVIQNTWIYEQVRLRARLFETLLKVSHSINSAVRLEETLEVVTREACAQFKLKMCALRLLSEDGQWLLLRACHGGTEAYQALDRIPFEESLLGNVARLHKPVQLEDIQTSGFYQHPEIARTEGLVSLLGVPLVFDGEPLGTLSVYTDRPHSFSNEEIRILQAMADLSAIAIEKARLLERIVEVEEELRQSEKLSVLGLLAAEVAHEIRNPLTVMKMLYHSLNLQFPDDDPRNEDVRIMGEKMDLLNRIVEKILDFARTSEPQPEPIDVNRTLEDLSLLTRHKLKEQNISLEKRLAPDLPRIQADPVQMEQVFLNLMLNAVEAMPQGGRLVLATRVARRAKGPQRVEIQFRDTGQGMTAEQQKRAFTSLLNTTKARGTGLGLAVVSKIIEGHNGKIRLRSQPGKGATFTVSLPIPNLE